MPLCNLYPEGMFGLDMSTTVLKSIRMIEFSGKKSDYHMWAAKVLAAGARKGYDKILDG